MKARWRRRMLRNSMIAFLGVLLTLRGLLCRQVPPARAHAALRLHQLPNVVLRLGASTTQSLERTRGVLTGAASSGMLARICLEDTVLAALPELETQGFQIDLSRQLSVMSWLTSCLLSAVVRRRLVR